jgi:hypothetical protein
MYGTGHDVMKDDVLQSIVVFLSDIHIPVMEGDVPADAFLPGLRVSAGALIYSKEQLRWPGDLLHEAGHIATIPAQVRSSLNDSLVTAQDIPHASEIEATAWAYAAVVYLKLPLSILFHDGGYHGHSAGLINTFSLGVYPGAFGLSQAGMTHIGADAERAGIPPYPHMTRWLRE